MFSCAQSFPYCSHVVFYEESIVNLIYVVAPISREGNTSQGLKRVTYSKPLVNYILNQTRVKLPFQ